MGFGIDFQPAFFPQGQSDIRARRAVTRNPGSQFDGYVVTAAAAARSDSDSRLPSPVQSRATETSETLSKVSCVSVAAHEGWQVIFILGARHKKCRSIEASLCATSTAAP
jgi:hypothetical protein